MTDNTYETESHHTPESRGRDARLVGHEPKGETMTDDPKCEPGCISYYGGEKKHHRDCPYYPESLTKLNADRIEELEAKLDYQTERLRLAVERAEKAEQRGYVRGIAETTEKVKELAAATPPAPVTVTLQEAARAWKAAREAAMKNVTPETFTELSKAESALSRALAEQEKACVTETETVSNA